ncbi:ABC transporter ATP-binding protein [Thalassotalea sp. ND16A]|uniref:ABC transporter ATP-binding protein n=1 Tax=Thalassotalea sp. ND16A TaxID=1535422 RepID=UPI00051D7DEF|nr:ATP-binding cassette domain-containing protein [Thalassotalea sp. ND16A]KGK00125.1 Phosphonate-transporting ATPase [Thalassotalea sp. ND16A]
MNTKPDLKAKDKTEPETILECRNVTKSVNTASHKTDEKSLTILKAIDMQVKSGESIAIIGASGSGKTTLLSLLAGLDLPSSGEIYLKGLALHQFDEEQRSKVRADHVGFIFQSFLLINSLTALENVMLPAELANEDNAKQKAMTMLAKVGLSDRVEHYPSQLSGGEQQRVAIARAFISNPDILFADEPTGNLDSKTGETITELLFQLNQQQGTTLVLVTHDKKLAGRCQIQLTMEAGEFIQQSDAAPEQLTINSVKAG